jgi:hypothetical protein
MNFDEVYSQSNQDKVHFHYQNGNEREWEGTVGNSLLTTPGNSGLASVPTFAFSRKPYKWNYMACSRLCLASFTHHNALEILPCYFFQARSGAFRVIWSKFHTTSFISSLHFIIELF